MRSRYRPWFHSEQQLVDTASFDSKVAELVNMFRCGFTPLPEPEKLFEFKIRVSAQMLMDTIELQDSYGRRCAVIRDIS